MYMILMIMYMQYNLT